MLGQSSAAGNKSVQRTHASLKAKPERVFYCQRNINFCPLLLHTVQRVFFLLATAAIPGPCGITPTWSFTNVPCSHRFTTLLFIARVIITWHAPPFYADVFTAGPASAGATLSSGYQTETFKGLWKQGGTLWSSSCVTRGCAVSHSGEHSHMFFFCVRRKSYCMIG